MLVEGKKQQTRENHLAALKGALQLKEVCEELLKLFRMQEKNKLQFPINI